MLRGTEKLREASESTDTAKSIVTLDGAEVRRVLLRKGIRFYKAGIEMYLQERLLSRFEATGAKDPSRRLVVEDAAVFSEEWIDLAGQMMPQSRFERLCTHIESGEIDTVAGLQSALLQIHDAYHEDEWAWVSWAYEKHFGTSIAELSVEEIKSAAKSWGELRTKFLHLILGDAEKEFQPRTRTGFGLLGPDDEMDKDFTAVRDTFEKNKFVKQIREEIEEVARRSELPDAK